MASNLQSITGVNIKADGQKSHQDDYNPEEKNSKKAYIDAINYIFMQLEGAYPSKFYTFMGNSRDLVRQAKQIWLRNLSKDLSPNQIKQGMEIALAKSEFFPDMSDVRRYAKTYCHDAYFPTVEAAYIEATSKAHLVMTGAITKWSHPFIKYVGNRTGWFELREKSKKEMFQTFKYYFQTLLSDYQKNQVALLEDQKKTPNSTLELKVNKTFEKEQAIVLKSLQYTDEQKAIIMRNPIASLKKIIS